MRTLRQLMECAGVDASGTVRLAFDYFGFARGRVPTDPDSDSTASVSVLDQARLIDGEHIHLNVIRVGFGKLTKENRDEGIEKLDYAIYRTRRVYRTKGLGIGRVRHFAIDGAADPNDRGDVGSEDEAEKVWNEWSVPNDGIDAFVVRNISDPDFVGISPIGGSCKKGSGDDGLLAGEIGRGSERVARTFAHEIGHFLGLKHNHGADCPTQDAKRRNLMAQTKCVPNDPDTNAKDIRNALRLTNSQGSKMRDHSCVTDGC